MKDWYAVLKYANIPKLCKSIRVHGYNLMALLHYARKGLQTFTCNDITISYESLYQQALNLAQEYQHKHKLQAGDSITLIHGNNIGFVLHLMALSALGAHVILINPALKLFFIQQQLNTIKPRHVVCEAALASQLKNNAIVALSDLSIKNKYSTSGFKKAKNNSATIATFTSGTTGLPKQERRNLNVSNFLKPFTEAVSTLKLTEDNSVLISVSLSHGYGLAALLLAIFLRKNIIIETTHQHPLQTILQHKPQCWVTIPTLINRLKNTTDGAPFVLPQLKIISGSEPLDSVIVQQCSNQPHIQLYNLYGTSETGLLSIATPAQLKNNPDTLGKPISGVKYKTDDQLQLWVQTKWGARAGQNSFNATGDKMHINEEGLWFHLGRIDKKVKLNGHLSFVGELKILIDHHFPALQNSVTIDETELILYIHNKIPDETLQAIKAVLLKECPKHLMPKSIKCL